MHLYQWMTHSWTQNFTSKWVRDFWTLPAWRIMFKEASKTFSRHLSNNWASKMFFKNLVHHLPFVGIEIDFIKIFIFCVNPFEQKCGLLGVVVVIINSNWAHSRCFCSIVQTWKKKMKNSVVYIENNAPNSFLNLI